MSKKNRLMKPFLGHRMLKPAMGATMSLIGMTTGHFHLHKGAFKDEKKFWLAIQIITGMEPGPCEYFVEAIFRIRDAVATMSPQARAEMIRSVDRRSLFEKIGVKLSEAVTPEQIAVNAARHGQSYAPARMGSKPKAAKAAPSQLAKEDFYKSWEWRTLRLKVIKEHGKACQCCGAEPGMETAAGEPVRICVDHIKPLSKFWSLRLERKNLQVLCDECNQGKGNWDETDFRPPAAPDEWIVDDEIDPAILAQLSPHGTFQ